MKEQVKEKGSFATQLLELGSHTAVLADELYNRQRNSLFGVIKEQTETKDSVPPPAEQWPPLLSDLRDIFWAIEKSLNSMNETLNLLEI